MILQQPTHVMDERQRILVADDDPLLCELMVTNLASEMTDVVCASDGQAAWDLAMAETFDLALIDLGMPVMDGFELIEKLRANPATARLPLIVATSRDDRQAIEKSYRIGATSFVTKPINWSLLPYQLKFVLRSCREMSAGDATDVGKIQQSDAVDASVIDLKKKLIAPVAELANACARLESVANNELNSSEKAEVNLIIESARQVCVLLAASGTASQADKLVKSA